MLRRRFFAEQGGLPWGAMEGEYSISPTHKVYFSKGSLYYDGTEFNFNEDQYTYLTAYTPSHLEYFFFCESSANSISPNVEDHPNTGTSFFLTDGNLFTGWTLMSNAESTYLFNERPNASKLYLVDSQIVGVGYGIVIAPDDYVGELKSTYNSLAEFEDEGLVFIPRAGIYSTSSQQVSVRRNTMAFCSNVRADQNRFAYAYGSQDGVFMPSRTVTKIDTAIQVRMVYPIGQ